MMSADTRVYLDEGERYPFYGIRKDALVSVIVPVDQATRWSQVMADFEQVQTEMEDAYEAAKAAAAEATRLRNAEDAVAAAQARLERVRWEQEHRPDNPASWPFIRVDDGNRPCVGPQHPDEKAVRAERMRLHNAWPGIRFDLKPYICVDGHHHLGRTS